jgi:hypothetical protein
MKLTTILVMLLFCLHALAADVKVEINPTKPVAGEVFQAYFRIFSDEDNEPSVNFSPGNVEVVGKSNQGVSTRTVYANGKLTVSREITLVYDLVAAKPGMAALRDINIQIGGKTIRHPTINLTVLKEPEVLADVFVMADVPKKNLYLGEGIVVRYYLYSKVPVSNLDIKKYPKLNNFLKRFLQEPERTERVSVDGQIYMRAQIYAAKLYPEKVGELKIDPLQLSATYPTTRAGDPFGAFGLSRDFKTKTINSETVKIEVRPLPEPIPTHFTGLVGQHEFQLQLGQTKLIVNEPLEVKLTVSGIGALENLEAPDFLKHPGLEEFESNGDLKIADAENATKVFDYTFLAKENMTIPSKEIVLSYFDANSGKYIATKLNVPEIVVAGAQSQQGGKNEPPSEVKNEQKLKVHIPPMVKDFAAPLSIEEWQWKRWLPMLNLSLAAIAVLISLGWMIKEKKFKAPQFNSEVPSIFKRGDFKLNEFIRWMTPLIKETGKSPVTIIKESPLPEESKRYFIDLLNSNDYKDYSLGKSEMEYKYQSSHFKELGRYIKSVSNEDSSQPS